MTPEELAEIEARNKQARTYMNGAIAAGVKPCIDGDAVRVALDTVDALLAEVRRLTPAPKVARAPVAKVAVWGPVRGMSHLAALRVNGRIRAGIRRGHDGVGAFYYAEVAGKATKFEDQSKARAHIEAWARGKGWEVRDA